MTVLPQISEAEFEVMGIVWKHAPISTNEITEKLLQTTPWSLKTIQTLIKRYFGGNLSAMVASCRENDRLSEIEIKRLRSLLCNKK